MKSKLTLHLDDDLKERAKRLADERGISVSRLVEDYFRLLLREPMGGDGRPSGASKRKTHSGEGPIEETFPPRIQDLREDLGRPTPKVDMDEETRRWIEAAVEKHQ